MPAENFRIEGVDTIRAVGRGFKEAGDGKEIKRDLARELRAAGKPAADDMRATLAGQLPQGNGLAAFFTKKKFSIRNRFSGNSAGIQMTTGKKHQFAQVEDTGILRHPVFADGEVERRDWMWVAQSVTGAKGVLEERFEAHADEYVEAAASALDSAITRLTRSIDGVV